MSIMQLVKKKKGLSKRDLTGCNIFTASAFKFSICAGLGLLLIPFLSAT